jgi:hypothetical protein
VSRFTHPYGALDVIPHPIAAILLRRRSQRKNPRPVHLLVASRFFPFFCPSRFQLAMSWLSNRERSRQSGPLGSGGRDPNGLIRGHGNVRVRSNGNGLGALLGRGRPSPGGAGAAAAHAVRDGLHAPNRVIRRGSRASKEPVRLRIRSLSAEAGDIRRPFFVFRPWGEWFRRRPSLYSSSTL